MSVQIVRPRWKVWEGVLAIIFIVLTMLGMGFLTDALTRGWKLNNLLIVFLASLIQTLLMVSAAWYFVVVRHGHSFRDLGFLKRGFFQALPQGVKWGIGLFFMVIILGMLQAIIYPSEPEPQDFAKILLMVDSPGELFLAVTMGVVLAPLGEEIYFRGFFYPAICQRYGAVWGIMITALFFSALHFDLYRLLPIAAGGIGLTYLYEKTGNLWTNIIAHGVWNAIMIALIFYVTPI
ncbi:MAG: CPBP family intramembrane glutamic endopeptidase [Bacillota bacterium]